MRPHRSCLVIVQIEGSPASGQFRQNVRHQEKLAVVVKNIREDIDTLYSLKKSVLEIAEKLGEAEYRGSHRTKQYWTRYIKWGVFTFHIPMPGSQTKVLDNLYKAEMDAHEFSPRQKYRPVTSDEIKKAKEILKQYLVQNELAISLSASVISIIDRE